MTSLSHRLRQAVAASRAGEPGSAEELETLAQEAASALAQIQTVVDFTRQFSKKVDPLTGAKLRTGENAIARRRLILRALPGTSYEVARKTQIPLSSVYRYLQQMQGTQCERDPELPETWHRKE